jgi:hypothetical protein
MKLVFAPLASRELTQTARKYEAEAEGLGGLFVAEVQAATEQIKQFPDSAPAFGMLLRKKILSRFPYSVLYAVGTDMIRVVAIMHQHRGPEFVARRLKASGVHEDNA